MKIEIKEKKISIVQKILVVDGLEVKVYDFLKCLEALEDTLRPVQVVMISNLNIKHILMKYKLAYKNNRGSWSKYLNTGRIAKFKDEVYKALAEKRKAKKFKNLAYYMSLPYKVKYKKIRKEDGGGWLAWIPQLGKFAFRGDGETKEEALKSLNFIKEELFKENLRDEINIPEPE